MQMIYIHGAPAVGKFTVAKELAKLTGARLFDNHASIDLARTVFDHAAPGFWSLVRSARVLVIEAAAQQGVPFVVMTSCYSEPHDRQSFETYEAILSRFNAIMCPVFLHCSHEEMRCRVGRPDRNRRGKIASVSGLEQFLEQYNCVPVPHADCIQINAETHSAKEAAADIVERFELS